MSWSTRLRQTHRWSSVVFTAAVIIVTVIQASATQAPPEWIYFMPLPPLGLLLVTGLPLFIQPYVARLRRGSTIGGPA